MHCDICGEARSGSVVSNQEFKTAVFSRDFNPFALQLVSKETRSLWSSKESVALFVDESGKEVIALKYDAAESFSDGLAKVKLNGKEFYIGKEGTEYYEP